MPHPLPGGLFAPPQPLLPAPRALTDTLAFALPQSLLAPPTHWGSSPRVSLLTCFHGQHSNVVPASGFTVQPLASHDGASVRIDVKNLLQIGVSVNGVPEGAEAEVG